MQIIRHTVDAGTPFCIEACAVRCGEDWTVALCGGTRSHVGAVSLAVYEPQRDSATVSTLTCYTHRDDRLSMELSKALARTLKCTVTVSVGIHVDDAGPAELSRLQENARQCVRTLCADMARAGEANRPAETDLS